ncbi:hypothetical protein [Paenibacillus mucilaginosus]|uniref:Uncharacterized protein n=3 Tax=Paenibacillus mucilaginosus TaxID=61624 RepID=H6N8Z8_9BACL|nr:hypothetical protein [Paenibacillus mucilaginosus]AEI39489.1 hypothetical protein KNP414_00899 [Paenibacillus mucilaginosus KNP414]AFC27744.1 hypothetical protein PM3016_790 [Paenibacillus mucilaginosus 3016]AFH59901.1 hypothetical protein B2K_04035 [Paenibacillus mucilaginosus K02]MCG7214687.1 hypothetical protein [Paenibacillus mucilaginosus]WDM28453.1 hypothetical protein KCX80_04200 [Paenibacillus mucilaginosus]
MMTTLVLLLAALFVLYRVISFLLLRRKDAALTQIDSDFASRLEQKEDRP